ncbi:(3R)-3-hydroxyacyl-CoA dehydrogenase-like isoform X1 [Dermacentor andersoni]|uniref:(3R)-3-hydroxyacyl-CoA dehydrogenase-like isoform X1 n=1 Tax=Dermacentor andersoni TaxID=34620 RepID=UPI002155194B|nr:estradiol 17-beta-dehydrogenase 8-like isoform X1 [Dermacentor andersoni]
MSLVGRLSLVTGGASGIGEATCLALAGEGATLVVADKQLEGAQKVTETLPGDAKHCAMYVDVADSASVDQLFHNVERTFSQPLSIVVNCAGIFSAAPFVECSDELFDEVIRVNLRGTFLVARAAARHMVNAGKALPDGGAAIVNVASIMAKCGWPDGAAYCASKAAVVALTKSAAQELAAHRVRCNVVLPGMTETPMIAGIPEEIKASGREATPLKRCGKPREIAEAIKYLCVPAASSFVTGAALEVTGGFYM